MAYLIRGPAFRSSDGDYLLQMADFIAHALLKQEEEPVPRVEDLGICEAFYKVGRRILYRGRDLNAWIDAHQVAIVGHEDAS